MKISLKASTSAKKWLEIAQRNIKMQDKLKARRRPAKEYTAKLYELPKGALIKFSGSVEVYEFIKVDGMYGRLLKDGKIISLGNPLDEVTVLVANRRGKAK